MKYIIVALSAALLLSIGGYWPYGKSVAASARAEQKAVDDKESAIALSKALADQGDKLTTSLNIEKAKSAALARQSAVLNKRLSDVKACLAPTDPCTRTWFDGLHH